MNACQISTHEEKAPIAGWAIESATLPVAFAQVREDSRIDSWVVEQIKRPVDVVMVASGGCTAAHLAATPNVRRIHLVDPNPSQLALSRLKLQLLATVDPTTRLEILGHQPMTTKDRQTWLEQILSDLDLPTDTLGPLSLVARIGPDYAGRYECVFAALRHELNDDSHEIETILRLNNPADQANRIMKSSALWQRIERAFQTVFARQNLVKLFGLEATQNTLVPFSQHFLNRLRHVLSRLPAASNSYLWQMLAGRYPVRHQVPWQQKPIPTVLPEVTWRNSSMTPALSRTENEYDFVHLSNIPDWLPATEAKLTLEAAWHALRPGGSVLIRQLNSALKIRDLDTPFEWHTSEASRLHANDRSFFYRQLHWGTKR